MARTEARIRTSIWTESPDFVELGPDPKLVYFTVLSQPKINLCGVTAYTPAAWANYTKLAKAAVVRAVSALQGADFVFVEVPTDELWVRTLTKNDRILEKPYMAMAMTKDFGTIQSLTIRERFLDSLGPRFVRDMPAKFPKAFGDQGAERFAQPFLEQFHKRFDG